MKLVTSYVSVHTFIAQDSVGRWRYSDIGDILLMLVTSGSVIGVVDAIRLQHILSASKSNHRNYWGHGQIR